MIWNHFSLEVLCLTFIVSKFHGSTLNSLPAASNWSKKGISRRCSFSAQILLLLSGKIFFDLFLFVDSLSYRYQIGLKWKIIWHFFILNQFRTHGFSHLNIRAVYEKTALMIKVNNWAQTENLHFTSNRCYGLTFWLRQINFFYKKRQI